MAWPHFSTTLLTGFFAYLLCFPCSLHLHPRHQPPPVKLSMPNLCLPSGLQMPCTWFSKMQGDAGSQPPVPLCTLPGRPAYDTHVWQQHCPRRSLRESPSFTGGPNICKCNSFFKYWVHALYRHSFITFACYNANHSE